jgi:hypothetical protein
MAMETKIEGLQRLNRVRSQAFGWTAFGIYLQFRMALRFGANVPLLTQPVKTIEYIFLLGTLGSFALFAGLSVYLKFSEPWLDTSLTVKPPFRLKFTSLRIPVLCILGCEVIYWTYYALVS